MTEHNTLLWKGHARMTYLQEAGVLFQAGGCSMACLFLIRLACGFPLDP